MSLIGLDFDGVIANYGNHLTETRFNNGLLALLPPAPQPVAIITNQGGMALHASAPERYPAPERVAMRLLAGIGWLEARGYRVQMVLISAYHPRADRQMIERAAAQLRRELVLVPRTVYTTERSRKPSPFMLRVARASVYSGDSPEDEEAARAAGVPFVRVPRFE